LKLLEKTHRGRIDLIYIDPPYNTGNEDFVYNDSYVDKTDTFRHSKWLSFMKKRLEIAKRILSDKGVIFISIDDNEQATLKLLCDDVFGENNFIANMIWKSKSGGGSDVSQIATDHEYVLAYAKQVVSARIGNDMDATVTTVYNHEDENGRYSLDRLDKQSLGYQPSLDFPIKGPDGKTYVVHHKDPKMKKARWRWGRDTVAERYDELVFIYPYVYTKNYEKTNGQKPRSVLFDERFGRTRTGSTDLRKAIGNQSIFTYPKPVSLLQYLIQIGSDKQTTVLDFFAGSGTTGHAVMKLNAEDGGRRCFILVTNNENGICEKVTYERLKRVMAKEKYAARLKYYKVGFVPITEDGYWERADALLGYIRELVELENGIDFSHDTSVAIVLTDEELGRFVKGLAKKAALPRILYKGHNVILDAKAKAAIEKQGVEVKTIPDYYYPEL
jgi:adenine-specific DNA-methyltransferase